MLKKEMKRLIILLIVAGGIGGYYYTTMNQADTNLYYGEIEPEGYDVYATVSGIIDEVLITEGETIGEAQTVIKLNADEATIRNQQAILAEEIATENVVKSILPPGTEEVTIQENTVLQLQSQMEGMLESIEGARKMYQLSLVTSKALKATYDLQQSNYDKTLELFNAGIATQMTLDNSQLSVVNSKSAYDSALLQSAKRLNDINVLTHQIDTLEVQIASAREGVKILNDGYEDSDKKMIGLSADIAGLDKAMTDIILDKYDVKAYNPGVVESINYRKGEFIGAGAAVVSIYDPDNLLVKIYVFEKDLMQLSIGMEMIFTVAYDETIQLRGVIESIASEAMFTPVNIVIAEDRERLVYEVEVRLATEGKARPGMLVVTNFNELEQ